MYSQYLRPQLTINRFVCCKYIIQAFSISSQVLIDQDLRGWKEVEYEVNGQSLLKYYYCRVFMI